MTASPDTAEQRRAARMALVDAMPPDLRALVHEYGLTIIVACRDCGIKQPRRIRHVVETVLNELSPVRGGYSIQGKRSPLNEPGSGPVVAK